MEQQKIYTTEEIAFLMSCCEPNHDGLIDYREFTERFHNPAKEIGFNLAVLLTNLSEHMPNDPRLQRFLETASSVLNYFEPFLGRIEIMGSANRIERVYFEIKEETIAQWEKPQIRESKKAFFYSIVTEGGDKEKLEAFVNFCEDAIFEMQHASSISMEEEEELTKAGEYPHPGAEEEAPKSVFEPVKKVLKFFWHIICMIFSFLTPGNIKKQWALLKEKTYAEIAIGFFRFSFGAFFFGGFYTFYCTKTALRFILRLMIGEPIVGPTDEEEEGDEKALVPIQQFAPIPLVPETNGQLQPVALISGEVPAEEPSDSTDAREEETLEKERADGDISEVQQVNGEVKSEATLTDKVAEKTQLIQEVTPHAAPPVAFVEKEEVQTEVEPVVASFNIGNYLQRFLYFLARNLYKIKTLALIIAFLINVMLLFYKVSSGPAQGSDEDELSSGLGSGVGSMENAAEEIIGSGEDTSEEELEEWIEMEEKLYYFEPILRILAGLHSVLSFSMLIGYYQLKVPLIIFKREKELARKIEFDGLYISEQEEENKFRGYWDQMVISTRSFPANYWDKFVKKRVREKYAEQYDYDELSKLLGMTKGNAMSLEEEAPQGLFSFITNCDWKYQIWKMGVTFTDNVSFSFT